MDLCRRRTMYIFGGLALLAALFVPYRSTHVTLNRDPETNTVWKRTHRSGGYMFILGFLGSSRDGAPDAFDLEVREALRRNREIAASRTDLNTGLLAVEFSAIALLAAYDALFLCRRRRASAPEEEDGPQGDRE